MKVKQGHFLAHKENIPKKRLLHSFTSEVTFMDFANSDLFLVIGIITIFSAIMSPTLCWLLTAKDR